MEKRDKTQQPVLTPELKKEIIELTTMTAIRAYHSEADKQMKVQLDKRIHNTKLLLKNYRDLKIHSEDSVYEASKADESAYEILSAMSDRDPNENYVESIKRSVGRTVIILNHVDEMLRIYEISCKRSQRPEDMRRYTTIYRLYIDTEREWSPQDVADDENVDLTTVYRDVKEAVRRLTALIFGIDGLKK